MGEKMRRREGDGLSLLICQCGCKCTVFTDSGIGTLAWGVHLSGPSLKVDDFW